MTITLTSHQLAVLKALVEYAALNTGDGANADETTEILLRHIIDDSRGLAAFVSKAREALKS